MTQEEKDKFYGSTAWRKLSAKILRRDRRECQECRKRIEKANRDGIILPAGYRKIRRATLTHHIIPIEVAPELMYDEENLEAVCVRCHNEIHGRTLEGLQLKPFQPKERVTTEKW